MDCTPEKFALVTGATGFTGGRLARTLADRGYRVRALARTPDGAAARALTADGIEIVKGDVTDAAAVTVAMQGVTHLFNVAAAYRDASHPNEYYFRVNRDAVELLLRTAEAAGVCRIVHCSTCGVHGDVAEIPANEETALRPGDVYQQSKLEGEQVAQRFMAEGAPVAVIRPTGIYGPGDLRFLKLFRTIGNGTFRMFGDGEVAYHMTYVDDIVAGMILAAEHPDAVGEVFLIGDEEYTTLNRLTRQIADILEVPRSKRHLPVAPLMAAAVACETICRPFGIDPPLHRRRVAFFTKARAFSIDKAKRTIGFQPQVGLEEGLRRTAEWYRETGRLPDRAERARSPAEAT